MTEPTTTTARASGAALLPSTDLGAGYEVDVPYLKLTDPQGHKHYLTQGQSLPSWTTPQTVSELVANGAVFEFKRI